MGRIACVGTDSQAEKASLPTLPPGEAAEGRRQAARGLEPHALAVITASLVDGKVKIGCKFQCTLDG